MNGRRIPHNVNLALFLATLLLTLLVPWRPTTWEGMGDPPDYLRQSKMSLLDAEFYAPHAEPHFYPRAFTAPLFYKMAGSDPDIIVQVQKFVHVLSAFLLVAALIPFMRSDLAAYIAMAGIYLLLSWWSVLGWTIVVLSESLSMSFLFIWLASLLWLVQRKDYWAMATHLIVTLLFSFTRDSWPYILVGAYGILVTGCFVSRSPMRLKSVALLAFALAISAAQVAAAQIGDRYRLPLINTVVIRMVPNKQYYHWFAEHGTPCLKTLKRRYPHLDADKDDDRVKVYDIYTNAVEYQRLWDWALGEGNSTYVHFMLTHPSYVLLLHEKPEKLKRIFAHSLDYTSKPRGYSVHLEKVFPLFHPLCAFLLCCATAALYVRRKDPILLMPAYLVLIVIGNTVLSYSADALEVPRHMIANIIVVQLIGFISVALLADAGVAAWRS